ncbi:MAG: hypothetical protein M0020_06765 [Actinomycetota bacterium]|nr:hypothetical protein [Actinomycetota bacterium]
MKKGRHRRFEEARSLKRAREEVAPARCPECGAGPGGDHASWCLAEADDDGAGYSADGEVTADGPPSGDR